MGCARVKWELLGSAAWRWKNPADVVDGEDVYIEFTVKFDLVDAPSDPIDRHINVYVSWLSAGGGCVYDFCLQEGVTSKIGSLFDPGGNAKIVVAVPHMMDHGTGIGLSWTRGVNVHEIVSKVPTNSINHPAAHLCEPDGDENTWHTHSSGETGHLQVGGLSQHHDGLWLDHDLGDKLVAVGGFDVPAHSVAAPINRRALWMVFWHPPGGAQ